MILVMWGGLPAVGIVIGDEVFLCMIESVFGGRSIPGRVECGGTVYARKVQGASDLG